MEQASGSSSSPNLDGNLCAICTSASTEKLVNVGSKGKKKIKRGIT